MNGSPAQHRQLLQRIARRAMSERGFRTEFSPDALAQVARLEGGEPQAGGRLRDLRELPWCSIDNDDTRDIDQLTVALTPANGVTRILVAIADVDALVEAGSPIDVDAHTNTTTVYTDAEIFPMLPERLSTDLTSLNDEQDRAALVMQLDVAEDGRLVEADVLEALVRNRAKLAYDSLAAWLEGDGPEPPAMRGVPGLAQNLRLQDAVARALAARRHERGALDLQTVEARASFELDRLATFKVEEKNRTKQMIEDFMIAANGVTARFLEGRGFPSLRRVVRAPKRWNRIVELAASWSFSLPAEPDARALGEFLASRRAADPLRFPDVSLAVVKLLGSGEYVADLPGAEVPGHFGLAVKDYGHSTAPNRRYPDLVTHRLIKAALAGSPAPYHGDALVALARHCTLREDEANKVERLVHKSAAALLLADRRGDRFEALVTGAASKGTWVRLLRPPVEGRVIRGERGLDVGDRVTVELVSTDVERGFIDFARVG